MFELVFCSRAGMLKGFIQGVEGEVLLALFMFVSVLSAGFAGEEHLKGIVRKHQ